jgi:ureidoacrylate peracid hydrolase
MASNRTVTIEAKPEPITIDTGRTAALVVDMQNDFGAKGGMFDRAGIDISGIRGVMEPTARVLTAMREAGILVVYLKMGYQPDLSDLGAPDSPNRTRRSHESRADPGDLEHRDCGRAHASGR